MISLSSVDSKTIAHGQNPPSFLFVELRNNWERVFDAPLDLRAGDVAMHFMASRQRVGFWQEDDSKYQLLWRRW